MLSHNHQFRTVLVAASDTHKGTLVCRELTAIGCLAAGPFASNAEAIEWLSDNPADVALLDVRLEDGPSRSLAQVLESEHVPLVFYGAYARADGKIHAEVPGQPGAYRESTLAELLDAFERVG